MASEQELARARLQHELQLAQDSEGKERSSRIEVNQEVLCALNTQGADV
jgi:hypothetical protein